MLYVDVANDKPLCVDKSVLDVFPDEGAQPLSVIDNGKSHWGRTGEVKVKLPNGEEKSHFLKVIRLGIVGREMCEGEYESLTAMHAIVPGFCPQPYAWGKFHAEDAYFLLTEHRHILTEPAEPDALAQGLGKLHTASVSPTGQFGFHVRTSHTRVSQNVALWDDSWCVVFTAHLRHIIAEAQPVQQLLLPKFEAVARLLLARVVPRLLLPLQQDGRVLKPSLLHGDCWDGNTGMDERGGAVTWDLSAFYGHAEYDVGNWRAPRHALSDDQYLASYQKLVEPSEPKGDWDARNRLYSLGFNLCNAMYVPGSDQGPVVYQDMVTLCEMFCKDELVALGVQ